MKSLFKRPGCFARGLRVFSPAAFFLLTVSLNAQPIFAPQIAGATFTCAASTATNLGYVVRCGKQANVNFTFLSTNTLDLVGTTTVNYYYQRSVDGTYYETNMNAVGVPGQGKNVAVVITNIPTQGAGFIRWLYATNAAGGSTNLGWGQIWYGVKENAP